MKGGIDVGIAAKEQFELTLPKRTKIALYYADTKQLVKKFLVNMDKVACFNEGGLYQVYFKKCYTDVSSKLVLCQFLTPEDTKKFIERIMKRIEVTIDIRKYNECDAQDLIDYGYFIERKE